MGIKRNIGLLDMLIRLSISLVMIYFGFIDENLINDQVARLILGIFGCLSLLVVLLGYCPFYSLIGFNSSKSK